MTEEEHKKWHQEKHYQLDCLVADWIENTGHLPSKATVFELMEWSNKQTQNPHKLNS